MNALPKFPAQIVSAAQDYARQGYHVFPCKPDKSPYTEHGFKDATTDPFQIERWLQQWPDAMIGMATGARSGIVVIDVDIKNGVDGFAELAKRGIEMPTDAVEVKTPSGGSHFYFSIQPGQSFRNSAGKIAPGVDVRADGGYVIVPPSRPAPDGPAYHYARDGGRLSPLPDTIAALMVKRRDVAPVAPRNDDTSIGELEELLSYLDPDCGYDDWNTALTAVHSATGGSSDGLAIADAWSKRGHKYPGSGELVSKWKSYHAGGAVTGATLAQMARDRGADLAAIRHKHQARRALAEMPPLPPSAPPPQPAAPSIALPEITADSFAGKPIPEMRSHDAKGMIPGVGVTLIYGDGGTGKSTVAIQLAASTVLGRDWLGVHVRRGPVYYFSAEDPIDVMHKRLADYAAFIGADLAAMAGLHIAPMLGRDCVMAENNGKGIIQKTAVFHAVAARVAAVKPALIIMDNAIDIFAGDANDAAQVKQFMHLLSGLSIIADSPVVLLAHPSRSGMANGTGDGNSVHWSNSARSRLYLYRRTTSGADGEIVEDDPCARVLKVMKSNYSATGDEIGMRWEAGCFA